VITMDVWLLLRILVYIMGGVLPFIYNYYYVKRKVKGGKEVNEKTSEENSIVVSDFTFSSELRGMGIESGNTADETIEPITIVSSTSIVSPHAYDDRGRSNPLYVVLLIDHNVMRNPEALTKMVLNVPKIVNNIESKFNKK